MGASGRRTSTGSRTELLVGFRCSSFESLALGLDVPEDDLIAVARGKPARKDLTENEAKLLSNFRQLYADRREDVLIMLNALAARFPH